MKNSTELMREYESLMKKEYYRTPSTADEKIIEGLQNFVIHSAQRKNMNALLLDALKTIHRLFPFQEVSIGLKSAEDGKYRYEALLGYSKEAEETFRNLEYTHEEMFDPAKYPGIRINKYLELSIGESQPFVEEEIGTYNRQRDLPHQRESLDEFLEGDYIDLYMYGEGNELIGWIELSDPRDSKMPDIHTLKWLELFASILSVIIGNRRQ